VNYQAGDAWWVHVGAASFTADVQVDLEIAGGAVHAAKLENALRNADFAPDDERSWRWVAESGLSRSVIKFELLADLDDQPAGVRSPGRAGAPAARQGWRCGAPRR